MNVTCTTKKNVFKNLTVNKDYDATEDGDMYSLNNDAGIKVKYAKKYFKVNIARPVIRDFRTLLTIRLEDDRVIIILNRTTRTVLLYIERVNNSCGIITINNLHGLKDTTRDLIDNKMTNISGTYAELFREIMIQIMSLLKEVDNLMCYMFSDRVDRPDEIEMNAVMDELSDIHTEGENPNTGNQIALWILK